MHQTKMLIVFSDFINSVCIALFLMDMGMNLEK